MVVAALAAADRLGVQGRDGAFGGLVVGEFEPAFGVGFALVGGGGSVGRGGGGGRGEGGGEEEAGDGGEAALGEEVA